MVDKVKEAQADLRMKVRGNKRNIRSMDAVSNQLCQFSKFISSKCVFMRQYSRSRDLGFIFVETKISIYA